jgi:hypothetical protein
MVSALIIAAEDLLYTDALFDRRRKHVYGRRKGDSMLDTGVVSKLTSGQFDSFIGCECAISYTGESETRDPQIATIVAIHMPFVELKGKFDSESVIVNAACIKKIARWG